MRTNRTDLILFNMLHTIKRKDIVMITKFLSLFFFICLIAFSCKQQSQPINITTKDTMVRKFYDVNHGSIYWFSSGRNRRKATEWINAIESKNSFGMVFNKLQTDNIRAALSNKNEIDSTLKEETDQQITGIVLNFLKELQEGNVSFDYDEVSVSRDSVYIYQLINSKYKEPASEIISRLDCKDPDYLVLQKYMEDSISVTDTLKYKKVVLAMNYRRYLTVNRQLEYVLVNIPTAEAEYYKNGMLKLKMRTVPGNKINRTPTIASHITSIVTFPHWNVPHNIAVNEILPKVRLDEFYLEQHNFEVVDAKGNVLNDSLLNWAGYTAKNFPYFFRQSTGANNSLGVIKFDLKNPYSIFLHSTSWQGVFQKKYRFLSHGCIRMEKPIELANALLRGKIDIRELKIGKENTESTIIDLPTKVPVYLIYVPVTVTGNKVTFIDDVYGLI